MPLQRRLPKVGFRSKMKDDVGQVFLYQLALIAGDVIDFPALQAANLVSSRARTAKIVKKGELDRKIVVRGLTATAGAKAAIEAAGGSVE
jgi:large subunit ribosomal protein L15